MKVLPVTDEQILAYLTKRSLRPGDFLQHPLWLKVQQSDGFKTFSLGFFNDHQELIGLGLGVWHRLFGRCGYVFFPRGPLLNQEQLASGLTALADYFKHQACFIRFEPNYNQEFNLFKSLKTVDVNPKVSWLTNLSLGESDILSNMHAKTRYNIRLSHKNNLVFKELSESDSLTFWRLLKLTSRRDGFALHSLKHYENLFKIASFYSHKPDDKQPIIKFFGVFYQEHLVAAAAVVFYGSVVTYLHGASDYKYRKLMAPYFLHWQIIKYAQKVGCQVYDWWGIALSGSKQKAWQGITRFKVGWGGEKVIYPGTFDYPINKLGYIVYRALRATNRLVRQVVFILKILD